MRIPRLTKEVVGFIKDSKSAEDDHVDMQEGGRGETSDAHDEHGENDDHHEDGENDNHNEHEVDDDPEGAH